eukprot:snap_masked-scaffold_44-processed-gene-1.53-mRNA-1 protein AED:0.71 eAED:0.71 QI:0/-1/0/1/-1/1/1/0/303
MIEVHENEIQVGTKIGGGGFGIVYRSSWEGKDVAMKKILDPRITRKRNDVFKKEIKILLNVRNKNIVKLLAISTDQTNLFMILELCEGNLGDELHEKRRKFDMSEKFDILLGVSNALKYLHSFCPPVFHRDVKSQNILLLKLHSSSLVAKLCDFGIATLCHPGIGTPPYMAPELLLSEEGERIGVKVDVYALGILIGEILAERRPFASLSVQEITQQIIDDQRPGLGKTVERRFPKLVKLINKCCKRSPRERPTSKDVKSALKFLQKAYQNEENQFSETKCAEEKDLTFKEFEDTTKNYNKSS